MEQNELEQLRELIDASGIRKGELEETLGIPQSTLSKVIRGERKLKPGKMAALKRICNKAIKEKGVSNVVNLNQTIASAPVPLVPIGRLSEEQLHEMQTYEAIHTRFRSICDDLNITGETAYKALNLKPIEPRRLTPEEKANWEAIMGKSWVETPEEKATRIYELGQRFQTRLDELNMPEDAAYEILKSKPNMDVENIILPTEEKYTVIPHEEDIREFPRPKNSIFKYL